MHLFSDYNIRQNKILFCIKIKGRNKGFSIYAGPFMFFLCYSPITKIFLIKEVWWSIVVRVLALTRLYRVRLSARGLPTVWSEGRQITL